MHKIIIWVLSAVFIMTGYGIEGIGAGSAETGTRAEAPVLTETLADAGLEEAEIISVTDGDTLKVSINGEKHTVRLIGVDTPESVHSDQSKNSEFGTAASDFTKSFFSGGQKVFLQKDVSETDRYGRLLRYLWVGEPSDSADEAQIREKMFNAILVIKGYANAYRYPPDTTHSGLFSKLEIEAYEEKAGLWAENGLDPGNVQRQRPKDGEYRYIGNIKSKKYHSLNCGSLPAEENRVYFQTAEEAESAGYVPCGSCKPNIASGFPGAFFMCNLPDKGAYNL